MALEVVECTTPLVKNESERFRSRLNYTIRNTYRSVCSRATSRYGVIWLRITWPFSGRHGPTSSLTVPLRSKVKRRSTGGLQDIAVSSTQSSENGRLYSQNTITAPWRYIPASFVLYYLFGLCTSCTNKDNNNSRWYVVAIAYTCWAMSNLSCTSG